MKLNWDAIPYEYRAAINDMLADLKLNVAETQEDCAERIARYRQRFVDDVRKALPDDVAAVAFVDGDE